MDSISLAAIVQGITECMPISSSAHLVLLQHFYSFHQNIHDMSIGTTIATMFVFRRYIMQLAIEAFSSLASFYTIASVMTLAIAPISIIGIISCLNPDIVTFFQSHNLVIYAGSFLSCIFLYISDRTAEQIHDIHRNHRHALLVGLVQCFAIIPGVSRLGITLSMARILGYGRMESMRFAFVMAIPVHIAASLLHSHSIDHVFVYCNFIAMISSLCTFFVLSRICDRLTATPFVIYRLCILLLTILFV